MVWSQVMPRNLADYEEDFYAWTVEQARLLRSGEFSSIDVENVAEEIESLGRSDKRQIESRLTVLLTHLLKWQMQSAMRSSSWSGTIREQRRRIQKLLRESPSLRPFVPETLAEAYSDAREDAAEETGLPETEFPAECPFTSDEVLSRGFLPER
jgi:ribosomal protein L29